MPHLPDVDPRQHATHDRTLVAAYAAGDATGRELETATALVARCPHCAALHHDLRAIAAALPALPAPARTRDFTLTQAQAASLRPAGWRRWLGTAAGPRFRLATPLGAGLATLGVAGLLFAAVAGTPLVPASGSTAAGTTAADAAAPLVPALPADRDASASGGEAGQAGGAALAAPSAAPSAAASAAPSAAAAVGPVDQIKTQGGAGDGSSASEAPFAAASGVPAPGGGTIAGVPPGGAGMASAPARSAGAGPDAVVPQPSTAGAPWALILASVALMIGGIGLVLARVTAVRAGRAG